MKIPARLLCAAVLPLLLCVVRPVSAAVPFASPEYGISLRYPEDFEFVSVPNPAVPFSIRHRTSAYPTFNIVVEPGPSILDPGNPEQHENYLLGSYRSVGLTDVTLQGSGFVELAGGSAFRAFAGFSNQGAEYKAAVVLLTTPQWFYIMTFIDRAAAFEGNRHYLDEILQSVALAQLGPSEARGTRLLPLALMALAVAAAGTIVVVRRKRAAPPG